MFENHISSIYWFLLCSFLFMTPSLDLSSTRFSSSHSLCFSYILSWSPEMHPIAGCSLTTAESRGPLLSFFWALHIHCSQDAIFLAALSCSWFTCSQFKSLCFVSCCCSFNVIYFKYDSPIRYLCIFEPSCYFESKTFTWISIKLKGLTHYSNWFRHFGMMILPLNVLNFKLCHLYFW